MSAPTIIVDPRYADWLTGILAGSRQAILDGEAIDLDTPANRDRADQLTAAYTRILDGIAAGAIETDPEVAALLAEDAAAHDDDIEYERVAFEHRAFAHLLDQIPGEAS